MITQTIKRWLHKLFAWWRDDAQAASAQPVSDHHTQVSDATGRTGEDGTAPQLSPVAVEREADKSAGSTEVTRPPETSSESALTTCSVVMPSAEQRLEFLRYLVRRGSLNEGFEKGEIPEQYRSGRARKK
jgi:hypothetical protein